MQGSIKVRDWKQESTIREEKITYDEGGEEMPGQLERKTYPDTRANLDPKPEIQ